jgi:hypothetical protein
MKLITLMTVIIMERMLMNTDTTIKNETCARARMKKAQPTPRDLAYQSTYAGIQLQTRFRQFFDKRASFWYMCAQYTYSPNTTIANPAYFLKSLRHPFLFGMKNRRLQIIPTTFVILLMIIPTFMVYAGSKNQNGDNGSQGTGILNGLDGCRAARAQL